MLTPDFRRTCVVNFLLNALVYALVFGVSLCSFWHGGSGLSDADGMIPNPFVFTEIGLWIYPLFLAGLWAVGPLHAYLVDAFRRRNVLLWALVGAGVVAVVAPHAMAGRHYGVLAFALGVSYGAGGMAGITLSIDVVPSGHRTWANVLFALSNLAGMLVGGILWMVYWSYPWGNHLHYALYVLPVLALLTAAYIRAPFRAPIVQHVFHTDRFLFLRGWIPALNVALWAFAVGLAMPLFPDGFPGLAFMVFLILPLLLYGVVAFVKLSFHCQRDTANTFCALVLHTALIGGLWAVNYFFLSGISLKSLIHLDVALFAAALLMWIGVTRPYYRKKRLR